MSNNPITELATAVGIRVGKLERKKKGWFG